jgi:hypothetical protein
MPKRFWPQKRLFSVLQNTVDFLLTSLQVDEGARAFANWQTTVAALYGEVFERPRLRDHCEAFAKQLNLTAAPSQLVFALQTIYSLLARLAVVQHLFSRNKKNRLSKAEMVFNLAEDNFYQHELGVRNFLPALWDEGIVELLKNGEPAFSALMEFSNIVSDSLAKSDWQNILTTLYQTIIPRAIRHDLGEFFTPDWLADKTLTMAGFNGEIDPIVFDPGCGSGIFLLSAAAKKIEKQARLNDVLDSVFGCDLNPLSVLSARLNLLVLLAQNYELTWPDIELPVLHYDTVFQTPLGNTTSKNFQKYLPAGCDYLVGNPPWISWNCLPPAYRQRLEKELLTKYVLFDFHGQAAQLGHGNDDFLSTFALITIHRHLRQDGICSFIIKQPLLTNVSGKTFRHFSIRHVDDTIPLHVVKVADLRALDPFGLGNETAILVLQKGAETTYPVEYEIWSRNDGQIEMKTERAQPIRATELASPWIILSENWATTRFMEGQNPYEIRHGLKHDAADILIIDIVEKFHQCLRIKRRGSAAAEIYEIEPDWVYPFLQPRHLQSWGISDYAYFILPQRKAGEDNESELAKHFPATYDFLKLFKAQFAGRRSKVFRNKPFYGLFGLGEYTQARYKVCWVGLGFQPYFVVVEDCDDPFLGRKNTVPDGTIYFIPRHDRDEAHFVCALLNSGLVRTFLSARSGKSKRGLSKKVVEQLAVPKFNRNDQRHAYLAAASLQLHEAFRRNERVALNFEEAVCDVFQNN